MPAAWKGPAGVLWDLCLNQRSPETPLEHYFLGRHTVMPYDLKNGHSFDQP